MTRPAARPEAAPDPKVTGRHLARAAYLYVRQRTLRQVVENTESGGRQYALRPRAVALGLHTLLTPFRAPRANAIAERVIPPCAPSVWTTCWSATSGTWTVCSGRTSPPTTRRGPTAAWARGRRFTGHRRLVPRRSRPGGSSRARSSAACTMSTSARRQPDRLLAPRKPSGAGAPSRHPGGPGRSTLPCSTARVPLPGASLHPTGRTARAGRRPWPGRRGP